MTNPDPMAEDELEKILKMPLLGCDIDDWAKAINAYTTNKIIQKEEQARQLNDGLRRAAEFMHKNGLLPPDTTTVDGIRSYFLNEARFAELRKTL